MLSGMRLLDCNIEKALEPQNHFQDAFFHSTVDRLNVQIVHICFCTSSPSEAKPHAVVQDVKKQIFDSILLGICCTTCPNFVIKFCKDALTCVHQLRGALLGSSSSSRACHYPVLLTRQSPSYIKNICHINQRYYFINNSYWSNFSRSSSNYKIISFYIL